MNDPIQDNQTLREEEEDKEWRLKMCNNNILIIWLVRPSEEELYERQTWDKQHLEEERMKLHQEKEIVNNFRLAQANLTMKNQEKIKKFQNIEIINKVWTY